MKNPQTVSELKDMLGEAKIMPPRKRPFFRVNNTGIDIGRFYILWRTGWGGDFGFNIGIRKKGNCGSFIDIVAFWINFR